ncbi:hypothetical protein [Paraburkholderia aromaticivorans]|uniref:hypothetical protein n=1 Tax=Paraburkholderia aromaticivorans TaxID=2026199 RepID=UPI0014562393|nr:hypothetical protein [Paraburkholderia aromaticivorans]
MSANKSYLSSAKYGYDFVVATTQASINSGLKEYLATIDQPATDLCFLANQKGLPSVEISLNDLKAKTGGIDPFAIPDGTDYGDPRITTLTKNMFLVALRLRIGLPPGVMPKDMPPIVDLGSSANNVTFNLFCSDFQIVMNSPPSGFGGPGSWNVWSQPSGTPWYFSTTVNLVYADLDKKLDTPYFNNHPAEKQALLNQLKNINSGAFSLQQLLFELDNASIQSVPKIAGLDPSSDAGLILTKAFVNLYFAIAKEHGEPVLSVHAVANAPDNSSLRLTGMEREVGQFVDGSGVVVEKPTPEQKAVTTLCYLCAANNNPLPGAAGFNFNWVDPNDVGNQSGVLSVNRNALANYYKNILSVHIQPQCLRAWTSVRVWPGGTAEYNAMVYPNNNPQTITISPTGSDVLTLAYESKADNNDKSGATYGELDLHTALTCKVSFSGNTITISQHLTLWLKVQWDLTYTDGNIVDKTLTDTYTLSVGQNGRLQVKLTQSTPSDSSQDIDINAFSNFFVDLNSVIKFVKDRVNQFSSVNLQDIPANDVQNFVFPGAKVFTYKDAQFSENQDLITAITYAKPT